MRVSSVVRGVAEADYGANPMSDPEEPAVTAAREAVEHAVALVATAPRDPAKRYLREAALMQFRDKLDALIAAVRTSERQKVLEELCRISG